MMTPFDGEYAGCLPIGRTHSFNDSVEATHATGHCCHIHLWEICRRYYIWTALWWRTARMHVATIGFPIQQHGDCLDVLEFLALSLAATLLHADMEARGSLRVLPIPTNNAHDEYSIPHHTLFVL